MNLAQVNQKGWLTGLDHQGPVHERLCRILISPLVLDQAQQVQRIGMPGLGLKHLPVEPLGFVKSPLLMKLYRLMQRLPVRIHRSGIRHGGAGYRAGPFPQSQRRGTPGLTPNAPHESATISRRG